MSYPLKEVRQNTYEENKMKKYIKLSLIMIMCITTLTLVGCGGYVSSYNAFLMISNNTSKEASMSFDTFEGKKAFSLKSQTEGNYLHYTAQLDKGSATVYYDYNGTKQKLFSLNPGDIIDSSIQIPTKGKVYVIVETTEKCKNGSFKFTLKSSN